MFRRLASLLSLAGLLMLPASAVPDLTAGAYAQEPVFELTEEEDPRAVVEIDTEARAEAAEDGAWTFRFLVPTALVLSALIVVLVAAGYGFRVRGRYRVKE